MTTCIIKTASGTLPTTHALSIAILHKTDIYLLLLYRKNSATYLFAQSYERCFHCAVKNNRKLSKNIIERFGRLIFWYANDSTEMDVCCIPLGRGLLLLILLLLLLLILFLLLLRFCSKTLNVYLPIYKFTLRLVCICMCLCTQIYSGILFALQI